MHRFIIRNFGPIQSVELDVKDILVFIGPQASGKSTISKSVYFFRSLKDDLLRYILESIKKKDFEKPLGTYAKLLRKKFLDFWGSTIHLKEIYLAYDYGNGVLIEIDLQDGYVNPIFNKKFEDGFKAIIREARAFNQYTDRQNVRFLSSSKILAREAEQQSFLERIEKLASNLFNDDKDLIFIPAGRSLLATLSNQLQHLHLYQLDYPTRAFIERINSLRPLFSKSFDELITDKKQFTDERVDSENLSLARQIIGDILKARYRCDNEGEKLFFDDSEKYVKLNYASSGQQESIWILLLSFVFILENQDVFIVFEELEAHLYPEAQKEVIDLIALLANLRQNQIMITTHSPYILSAFNNLIYAHQLGQTKPKEVRGLVDRRLWIHPDRIGTFMIVDGMMTNIIDEDVNLIKTEAIDSASEQINSTFDELFNLDDE